MFSAPKITCGNYISYAVSPYHVWCRESGYPMLDVRVFDDGEWGLIEYLNAPTLPCSTKWHWVLSGLRNVELSPWIIRKYALQLDLERRHFWDEQEKASEAQKARQWEEDRRAEDFGERAFRAIRQNPDLMERISRNGIQEMALNRIARHIPREKMRYF